MDTSDNERMLILANIMGCCSQHVDVDVGWVGVAEGEYVEYGKEEKRRRDAKCGAASSLLQDKAGEESLIELWGLSLTLLSID